MERFIGSAETVKQARSDPGKDTTTITVCGNGSLKPVENSVCGLCEAKQFLHLKRTIKSETNIVSGIDGETWSPES